MLLLLHHAAHTHARARAHTVRVCLALVTLSATDCSHTRRMGVALFFLPPVLSPFHPSNQPSASSSYPRRRLDRCGSSSGGRPLSGRESNASNLCIGCTASAAPPPPFQTFRCRVDGGSSWTRAHRVRGRYSNEDPTTTERDDRSRRAAPHSHRAASPPEGKRCTARHGSRLFVVYRRTLRPTVIICCTTIRRPDPPIQNIRLERTKYDHERFRGATPS